VRRLGHVRASEWPVVITLFGYFFLLTSTQQLLKPARNAFFLTTAGSQNLPWAYIVGAVVSVVSTTVYARWITPLDRRGQTIGSLVFSVFTVVIFRLLLVEPTAWIAGAFYVWFNVFTLVLVSQFFTLGGDLFDPRQAKRIFGFIGTGGLVGGVVGSAVAGFLAEPLGTGNLMWLGCIQLLACAVLAARVFRIGGLREAAKLTGKRPETGPRSVAGGFDVIRRIPHLRMIAVMVFTAVLVSTFVDWLFSAAVEQAFPERPAQAEFFGRVFAAYNLLAFLFQLFFVGWMLRVLGVVGTLFALPLAMGGGVAWMMLAPGLWAASATKGADQTLRYSVDQAAREILYLPVPTILKQRARPFIDVVANRGGDAVVGVMILALSGTAILGGRGPAMIAMGLVIVWLLAVWGVRRTYRQALEKLLSVRDVDLEAAVEESLDSETARQITSTLTRTTPAEEVHYALDVLKIIPPAALHREMRELVAHPDPAICARALDAMVAIGDPADAELVRPLLEAPDPRVRALALHFLDKVEPSRWMPQLTEWLESEDPDEVEVAIADLIGSGDPTHARAAADRLTRLVRRRGDRDAPLRRACARALGRLPVDHPLQLQLEPLLADGDPGVVKAALASAGRVARRELVTPILSHLGARETRPLARDALAAYGENGLPLLSAALRDPRLSEDLRRWLPGVFVQLGTRAAYRALLEGLSALGVSKHRLYALKALNKMRRRHPSWEVSTPLVRSELAQELEASYGTERQLATLQDALAAGVSGDNGASVGKAYEGALAYQATATIERTFRLQGLLYSPQTIYFAYAGLMAEDPHYSAHALELLETALAREDAARLLPLIDPDLTPSRRAEIGRQWYPLVDRDLEEDLEEVLESGEPWLQAYAVSFAEAEFPKQLAPELERLATSGHPMVKPLARHAIEGHREGGMTMSSVERAAALRQVDLFSGLAADDLLQIASVAEERAFEAGDYLFYEGEEGDYMYLVLDGQIRIEVGGQQVGISGPGKSTGEFAILDRRPRSASAVAIDRTRTLAIHSADMAQILADNYSLVEGMFSYFTGIIRDMNEALFRARADAEKKE
jgi:AAA family ATP:ADP antiporter